MTADATLRKCEMKRRAATIGCQLGNCAACLDKAWAEARVAQQCRPLQVAPSIAATAHTGDMPAVEQRNARPAHEQDQHRAGDHAADMRPPGDLIGLVEQHHDELRDDPDAQHPRRRDPQRDEAEGQHPDPHARVQDEVGGDDAGDRAAGADQRQLARSGSIQRMREPAATPQSEIEDRGTSRGPWRPRRCRRTPTGTACSRPGGGCRRAGTCR